MEEIRVDIKPATREKIRVKQEQEEGRRALDQLDEYLDRDANSNQTPLGFNLRWPPLQSLVENKRRTCRYSWWRSAKVSPSRRSPAQRAEVEYHLRVWRARRESELWDRVERWEEENRRPRWLEFRPVIPYAKIPAAIEASLSQTFGATPAELVEASKEETGRVRRGYNPSAAEPCRICGGSDHWARECPARQRGGSFDNNSELTEALREAAESLFGS